MTSPAAPHIRRVVVLKADRVYAECIREIARRVFPAASIEIATSLESATSLLSAAAFDLFVTGIGATVNGDVLDLLSTQMPSTHTRHGVLVVSSQPDYRELATLRSLGVGGVFDSAGEPADQLAFAMHAVATGARYWSPTIVKQIHTAGFNVNRILRTLTTFEQLTLTVIGDGSDDIAAARELGISPATVATVRREIHRKLGVQHRGELVRVAVQHGFVRLTPGGVVRPGYAMLVAAHRAIKERRGGRTSLPENEGHPNGTNLEPTAPAVASLVRV